MITRIQALNFRCLRYVSQELGRFHVLVGPNGSGKTTFLDIIKFLGNLVSGDLEAALADPQSNRLQSTWLLSGRRFEMAVELEIPPEKRAALDMKKFDTVRYEVAVGADGDSAEESILDERVLLKESLRPREVVSTGWLFPRDLVPPGTIMEGAGKTKVKTMVKTVVSKSPGGNDNFLPETGKGWRTAFKLGPQRCALRNLPSDESKFPVATWLKDTLTEAVDQITLDSRSMAMPSTSGYRKQRLNSDGSNLPWIVNHLETESAGAFSDWLEHVRTAIPDMESIETIFRPEDGRRYLVVKYRNDLEAPSWMVSDGTLRLLALTILAYLPDLEGIWLVEEPENGIHPKGVETVFQSLHSMYASQVLLATHSPLVVSLAEPHEILCFAKTMEGATDIVRGSEHPELRDWKREENLSVLYAAGVLG